MTIANESDMLKADLDAAFSARVTALAAAKAAGIVAAGVYQQNFEWDGITSLTASALLTQSFTVPDDDQELLAMGGYVEGAQGIYTLTLAGGPLVSPISVSTTTTSNPADLDRYVGGANGEPLQVLLRGATYTLTVSGSESGDNRLRAFLLMRCRPRSR